MNPIELGPIGQGEIPYQLLHTFNDVDGSPADLTGFTGSWSARAADRTVQTKTASVVAAGQVLVAPWDASDFSVPGPGSAELWVVSASNAFLARFTYTVQPTFAG